MTDDEQRLESADNITAAILDCIAVLRKEQNKNFKGVWDDYIDDLVPELMDNICDIGGSLRDGINTVYAPEYERLTGHEMGVCAGRV